MGAKYNCKDCDAKINIQPSFEVDEIISCPVCGLDYVIKLDDSGRKIPVELIITGEDWGE